MGIKMGLRVILIHKHAQLNNKDKQYELDQL